MGSEPSPRRSSRGPLVVLIALLVAGALGVGVWRVVAHKGGGDGGGGGGGGGGDGNGGSSVSFEWGRTGVTVVSVRAKPPKRKTVAPVTDAVNAALTDMYLAAFVDPDRWQGGTFPDAFDAFEEAAARQAGKDLDALTLGSEASAMEKVEPTDSVLSMTVLVSRSKAPQAAEANVTFRATGQRKDGTTTPIVNMAHFFFRPSGGTWRVFSYTVTTRIGSAAPTSGATP